MSTATLTHQPRPATKAVQASAAQPAKATAPSRSAKVDDGTRLLATLAGAATLVILVFFLAVMWALSGYGPVN